MSLQTPEYIQASGVEYTAEDVRYQLATMSGLGECVIGLPDYRVVQRAAGANMSVDVAAGSGYVRGDTAARQGLYHVVNDATVNVVVSAADSTDPRIDQIVLRVYDDSYDGSGDNMAELAVIAGTPTTGADLDNRDGAAALPDTAMRLADILVDAGATSIVDADIAGARDFRDITVISERNWTPSTPTYPLGGKYDSTLLTRHPLTSSESIYDDTNWDPAYSQTFFVTAVNCQRHLRANTVRWTYTQIGVGTPLTGTYEVGIYNSHGIPIVVTSKSFSGALGGTVDESATFTEYPFEPGATYYAGMWLDNDLAGGPPRAWCYPTAYQTTPGLQQIAGGRDSYGLPDRLENGGGLVINTHMSMGTIAQWIPIMQISAE